MTDTTRWKTWTDPPVVERDEDAVRLVEDIIDATSTTTEHPGAIIPSERTGPAIVEALFGRPTVTMHYDTGRIEIDWQDTPTHRPRACIVARDLLDDIVERLNAGASEPVENHATPERTAEPGERLPDLPASAYPPGAVPLPDVVRTVPCGDPEHCASHGECIDYADEVLDALGDAIARAHDARPLVDAAPALAALSPDCKAGKCTACTGDAWSDRLDAHTDCEHPCHTRQVHPECGLVPLGESGVSKSPDGGGR